MGTGDGDMKTRRTGDECGEDGKSWALTNTSREAEVTQDDALTNETKSENDGTAIARLADTDVDPVRHLLGETTTGTVVDPVTPLADKLPKTMAVTVDATLLDGKNEVTGAVGRSKSKLGPTRGTKEKGRSGILTRFLPRSMRKSSGRGMLIGRSGASLCVSLALSCR